MKQCTYCGQFSADDVLFCTNCGATLPNAPSVQYPPNPQNLQNLQNPQNPQNPYVRQGQTGADSFIKQEDYSQPVYQNTYGQNTYGQNTYTQSQPNYNQYNQNQQGYNPGYPGGVQNGYGSYTPQPAQNGNTMGTVSLVLGILSILFCCIPVVNIGLAITSIILSVRARNLQRTNGGSSGTAVAGLICSIIGIIASVIFILFAIYGYMTDNDDTGYDIPDPFEEYEQYDGDDYDTFNDYEAFGGNLHFTFGYLPPEAM